MSFLPKMSHKLQKYSDILTNSRPINTELLQLREKHSKTPLVKRMETKLISGMLLKISVTLFPQFSNFYASFVYHQRSLDMINKIAHFGNYMLWVRYELYEYQIYYSCSELFSKRLGNYIMIINRNGVKFSVFSFLWEYWEFFY